MPLERTAATAGDHIDWMITSPDAIRFTLSSKLFQKARNWPAFLVSIRKAMVLSISGFVMLPLSPYLMRAERLHHHRRVHDADTGDRQDRRLSLERRIHQVLPVADRPTDQVRPDAERVGIVDRGDQRHPFGRMRREFGRCLALDKPDSVRCGALGDGDAGRQFAGDEDRHDLVVILIFLVSIGCSTPVGNTFLQEKYSMSATS